MTRPKMEAAKRLRYMADVVAAGEATLSDYYEEDLTETAVAMRKGARAIELLGNFIDNDSMAILDEAMRMVKDEG